MALYTYGINHPDFQETTKEFIWNYFKEKEYIQFDCETKGFDPHTSPLLCVQMGNKETQFVIHPSKLHEFKAPLERRTLIGHNIKFDLKFLYKNNIWPSKVYDTFLAESILTCGLKRAQRGLAPVAKKRLGVDLDKSVRDNIWNEGLTKRVIEYSGDDVKYLEEIKDSQKVDLDEWNLNVALNLDNEFVLCLAYIEYCGIKLDRVKWAKKMKNDLIVLKEKKEALNKYITDNNISKYIRAQMDLFSTERICTVNWDSPKQVVELFEGMGIPVTIRKKGKTMKTAEAKFIGKYANKFPIIAPYISYKEAAKVVSTYGQTWIDQINPVTNRLHTNFKQILNTGRLSSGGKNRSTGEKYQNLQNIPALPETRECFIPEQGNKMVISDYTAQEDFVFTELSREEKLIAFYNDKTRKRDGHSFVAKMCFPSILGDVAEEDVKKVRSDLRDAAKKAKFAIHYGGNGNTIAENINIPTEQGDEIYESYMEAFPAIKAYFDKCKAEALSKGYIRFNSITNRISFVDGYEEFTRIKKQMSQAFWQRWKVLKNQSEEKRDEGEYKAYLDMVKFYTAVKGNMEKSSLNYPVQGTAADVTKQAGVYFFDWIKKNKMQNTILIPNVVHDEYDAEAPEELAERTAKALRECMERAGKIYCTVVELKAEPTIADNWAEK